LFDLVIVCSFNGTRKLAKLVDNSKQIDCQYLIIAVGREVSEELNKMNLNHKKFSEYSPPLEKSAERGIDWLKTWHNTPILDNKNIKELFTYDGASLWWFIDYWFYFSSFYFNYPLNEMIHDIDTIENLIKTEKPDRIFIIDDPETQIGKTIEIVCKARNVLSTIIQSNKFSGIKTQLLKQITLQTPESKLFLRLARTLVRKSYWSSLKLVYRSKKYELSEKMQDKKKILIFSADYCVPVYNLSSLEIEKGDPYLYSVIDEMRKDPKNVITFVGALRGYSAGLSVMKKQLLEGQSIYTPFDSYLNLRMLIKSAKALRKMRAKLKSLVKSPEFKESLIYENIPLYDLLKDRYAFLFTRFSFEVIFQIEMMKRLLSAQKPNAIVITEETVVDGRAITVVGRSLGIPILCLQHGITGAKGMTDYDHNADDFGPNCESTAPYCPIPDKIALYGDFYKRACIQVSKYPKNILAVTGSPRYDILASADKIFKRAAVYKELSSLSDYTLDSTKKTVLLLTQPLPSIEERKLVLKHTYSVVKNLNDVQLIVKLHPGELNDKLHKKLSKELGLKNVVIVKNFDTFKLLFSCDLVVAASSTTLLEATALNKPIILLDFFKKGYGDFLQCKEAMKEVTTQDELADAVTTMLFDSNYLRGTYKSRSDFRNDHLYKIDGQASKRVADLINNMTKVQAEHENREVS
jgi:hypothetical protein